jgi:type VI secretion system protein ImpE
MTARDHYEAGRLKEAIASLNDEVKSHPTDSSRRGFLCELLCFAGELERADLNLDALGHQDPQSIPGISLFRQLVRAEQARQQFYTDGRVPELLEQPAPALKLHLEASILLRAGQNDEAMRLLTEAEEQRPKLKGVCNNQPFDDWRDLDDLTSCFFEVLTSNGKYYWIPTERVELIEFRTPQRPRDLLWRQAHMIVRGGPDGEVYLPTLYAGTSTDADDRVRLGRVTDWRGSNGTAVRGIGQRTFLVGNEARTILELTQISIGAQS